MQILNNFSKLKVVVVGDVMLDRYWWGSVNRISPEAPVPIVHLEKMSLVPGGAANVAANLVGLGVTPYLFGVKGEDNEAGQLDNVLSDVGVKDHFIFSVSDRMTTTKTRVVAHNQHVVRIDQENSKPVSIKTVERLVDQINDVVNAADAIIISDYAKGLLTDEMLMKLIEMSRDKNKPLVVDPKGKDFTKYKGATILTPNKREAAEACGLDLFAKGVVSDSGKSLLGGLDLKALLITEGEAGMTMFQNDAAPFHLDSWAHDVYDVTGAGDTVIATLTAAVAAGCSFVEAAKFANAAAGIVVGKIGTTHVTNAMLSDFLSTSEHNHLFESLHA